LRGGEHMRIVLNPRFDDQGQRTYVSWARLERALRNEGMIEAGEHVVGYDVNVNGVVCHTVGRSVDVTDSVPVLP
jgi:hypothetical protein